MKQLEEIAKTAIKQNWVESERDWGVRPDGYSLHKSVVDCVKYIEEYWAGMPDEVPDEYSRPLGNPYVARVSDEDWQEISVSKNGIRRWK